MGVQPVQGYEPRHDFDFTEGLKVGQLGEAKFGNFIDALTSSKVEVKTDLKSAVTGNFYIEYQQKTKNGKWVPSGIEVTDASYWAWEFHEGTVALETDTVRALYEKYLQEGKTTATRAKYHPKDGTLTSNETKGVLVPVAAVFHQLLTSQKKWTPEEVGNDS